MLRGNKEVDVIIFIEHIDRELDAACAIGRYLETLNLAVEVSSLEYDYFDVWKNLSPKVILLPYCKSENNYIVKVFKEKLKNGVTFVNMNYEQILSDYSRITKKPRDEFAKNDLIQFAWGQDFCNYLIDSDVNKDHIYLTGKPEAQILRQLSFKNKDSFKNELALAAGLSPEKKWIFMPLNDGLIFEPLQQIHKGIKRGSRGENSIFLKEYTHKSIFKLLGLLSDVIDDYNETYEFILRPHPSVTISGYEKLISDNFPKLHNRVKLSRYKTVKEWMICSDVCFTNHSTVGLDSAAIGVPTFLVNSGGLPEFSRAVWMDKFPEFSTKEDLVCILNTSDVISNEAKEEIGRYIDQEINSIVETSKAIHHLFKAQNNRVANKQSYWRSFLKAPLRLVRSKLRCLEMKYDLPVKIFTSSKLEYDYLTNERINQSVGMEVDIEY